jgi:metal-sulfur cluster biosynthetic enzyme
MSLDVAIIMSALERVDDPCSVVMGKNICEMGLVENVHVNGGEVEVVLCLTDPGCINFGLIRDIV